MKKILFAIILAATFWTCKGDDGPMGPEGPPGQDGNGAYWVPVRFVVNESDWLRMGNAGDGNSYFYADKEMKALTEDVYYDGLVIGYMETEDNVKQMLPYVMPIQDDNGHQWTRIYDFDYDYDFDKKTGYIRFYLKYSDFETQGPEQGQKIFNIIVVY